MCVKIKYTIIFKKFSYYHNLICDFNTVYIISIFLFCILNYIYFSTKSLFNLF